MVKTFAFERDVPTIVVYKQLMESKGKKEGMRLCNAETDNFKLPCFPSVVVDRQFAWLVLLRTPGRDKQRRVRARASLPACLCGAGLSYIYGKLVVVKRSRNLALLHQQEILAKMPRFVDYLPQG
jgi:hypothetical protein